MARYRQYPRLARLDSAHVKTAPQYVVSNRLSRRVYLGEHPSLVGTALAQQLAPADVDGVSPHRELSVWAGYLDLDQSAAWAVCRHRLARHVCCPATRAPADD